MNLRDLTLLMQKQNDQVYKLMEERDHWKRAYDDLQTEHIALKYDNLCSDCQMTLLAVPSGYAIEITCDKCSNRQSSWKKKLALEEERTRYWQRCWQDLNERYYGSRNNDGADH